MRESSVERKLRLFIKKNGGRAIKLQRTNKRGDPDRILVLPHGITVWAELKRPGEKPRDEQRRVHAWLRKKGHTVIVSDGTNLPQVFTFLRGLVTIARRKA